MYLFICLCQVFSHGTGSPLLVLACRIFLMKHILALLSPNSLWETAVLDNQDLTV